MKRGADGQLEPEGVLQEPSSSSRSMERAAGDQLAPEEPSQVPRQDAQMDQLVRPDTTKRFGGDRSDDEYQTVQESKQQRIGFIGSVVEAMEDEIVKIETPEGELRMRICEEIADLSYMGSADADLLEEAIVQTDDGGVLSQLGDRVTSLMMQALCPAESPEDCGIKSASLGEDGESIFEPGSRMGLEASAAKDYWEYDPTKSLWTRFIVVPRADFFHPGERGSRRKARRRA